MLRITTALFVFSFLAGCVSTTPAFKPIPAHTALIEINEWQLRGKIIVRDSRDAEKAKFTWLHDHQDYKIRLSGTLGMGTTYIYGSPDTVRLEQNGKEPVTAATPEQLVWDQLGQDIPISQLHYWVRGLAAPESPIEAVQQNDIGLFTTLSQAGWQLTYSNYQQVGSWQVPNKIEARRNDIALTIDVAEWQFPDTPI